jgi:toxin ParE1/3/4
VSRRFTQQQAAHADINAAVDYYALEAGESVALRFVEAFEAACRHIAEWPETGSSRFGADLGLPGLRHRRIEGFPYAIFYAAQADQIEVWRVLHLGSDIPAWMIEP